MVCETQRDSSSQNVSGFNDVLLLIFKGLNCVTQFKKSREDKQIWTI